MLGYKSGKYKPKFFPFSSGIPWKIDRGKYILPEIDSETWHKVLDGRNIIITAFGGLLESFFSLAAAEALVSFDPGHCVFWLGNQEYSSFARAQGLCKLSHINLTAEMLKSYPTPLFFDQNNNAYMNILNNYLIRTSYWGKYPETRKSIALEQIFENVMIPWRQDFVPKLRRLGTEFYDELVNTGKLRHRSRIILIVLKPTKEDVLKWSLNNIKEFSQLASSKGFKVVVFAPNTNMFYGAKLIAYEYDIRKILQVMKNSWMVFSSDVHWLLIAIMTSSAKVMSSHIDGPFDLYKNAEMLGVTNDIFTDQKWMSPIDAFTICEGLL